MKDMNKPYFCANPPSFSIGNHDMASPFRNIDVAFRWKNTDFPFPHEHTHWEVFTVFQGEILHTINGQKIVYRKGDSCLIRPKDRHMLSFIKGQEHDYQQVNFTFSNEFAEQIIVPHKDYEELINTPDILHFTLNDSEITSIYDRCLFTQNLPKEQYEASAKLIVSELLVKFFQQYLLRNPDYPVWFNNFLTYISNPSNFHKSLKELTQITPYSYSRLATIFKDYTGVTLLDYVTEKKMLYAKCSLRTTSLTTLQISEQIGYSSLSAFNHLFKKHFNTTPSEYRRKHKLQAEYTNNEKLSYT